MESNSLSFMSSLKGFIFEKYTKLDGGRFKNVEKI